jgi:predicted metal-binding membrane protein
LAEAKSPSTLRDSSERRVRLAGLAIFALAAAYTIYAAIRMDAGMPMPGNWNMPMMWMVMPGQSVLAAARMFLLMWQAMMIAMMLPSSWPMLELYRRTATATGERRPAVQTLVAGAGYFAVWLAFGAVTFALGLWVSREAMDSPALSFRVPAIAGAGLLLAGIYQLSPLKQRCPQHCRSPILFLGHVFRPGYGGAVRVGIIHGAFCAACCWALMLIQMILGLMNLGIMIVVAAVIAIEKLWSRGLVFARLAGIASIAAGIFLLAKYV